MDDFSDDFGSDADALASIGWGTDEDYGYYGEQYSIALLGPGRLWPISHKLHGCKTACRIDFLGFVC